MNERSEMNCISRLVRYLFNPDPKVGEVWIMHATGDPWKNQGEGKNEYWLHTILEKKRGYVRYSVKGNVCDEFEDSESIREFKRFTKFYQSNTPDGSQRSC